MCCIIFLLVFVKKTLIYLFLVLREFPSAGMALNHLAAIKAVCNLKGKRKCLTVDEKLDILNMHSTSL